MPPHFLPHNSPQNGPSPSLKQTENVLPRRQESLRPRLPPHKLLAPFLQQLSARGGEGLGKEVLSLTMGSLFSRHFLVSTVWVGFAILWLGAGHSLLQRGFSLNLRGLCGGPSCVTYGSSRISQVIRASADRRWHSSALLG